MSLLFENICIVNYQSLIYNKYGNNAIVIIVFYYMLRQIYIYALILCLVYYL